MRPRRSCLAPQPALHERLGLGQGCLELGRESVAVLKSMGRHLEQAGCRGATIERLADRQQLGGLEPVAVRRSGPGRDHLHQLGGPTCRSPPGIDKQHLLQLGQLRSQLGGELLHAAASHLFGQQRPNPVVTAQAVADADHQAAALGVLLHGKPREGGDELLIVGGDDLIRSEALPWGCPLNPAPAPPTAAQ